MTTQNFPDAADLGDDAGDAIRGQFDHVFRRFLGDCDSASTGVSFRYSTGEKHPLGNAAVFRRGAGAGDIARVLGPLVGAAYPSAAVLVADDVGGQSEAVESCGFAPAEMMPLMSVGHDELAATALPAGHSFGEVTPGEDAAWCEAFSVGYGLPLGVGRLFGPRSASERCAPDVVRHFAAEHEGEVVATSMLYLHDGLAGIYAVATRPEHRGKGLGAHMTAEPLRLVWGRGYRLGVLQASQMGVSVYERIGFRAHGNMALFVRVPGS